MKKIISILLVCSMILLNTATVFAAEADVESYDLSELFANYDEKSLSEMVSFIGSHPVVYEFIAFFRYQLKNYILNYHQMVIHMSGEYGRLGAEVWNDFAKKVNTDNCSKYLTWGARPFTPNSNIISNRNLLGEMGNKCFTVEIDEEFINYINSLSRAEGNIVILNFIMNLIGDEVVGLSLLDDYHVYGYEVVDNVPSSIVGDCNGNGTVNSFDGNLMRRLLSGNDYKVDPFAVDINADGQINAVDSFGLKVKMVG